MSEENMNSLIAKLLEPIENAKEIAQSKKGRIVCPYSSGDNSCRYNRITGKKPTRLDCYICENKSG